MLEKIKITIPKSTHEILLKDCDNFNFYKSNDILNKNLFLNTLIVNYYEKFSSNEEYFKEELLKIINENIYKNQNELLEKIINTIRKKENNELDKKTETINLKPTKLSEKHILFIENNLLGNNSISAFYRNLFNSYAHIPQNYRELIIFKETYENLIESIEKERTVCITLNNNEVIKGASVYKIESSKGVKNCLDPYAKSMAAYCNDGTSGRAALVDLSLAKPYKISLASSVDKVSPQEKDKSKTVIYEISVRDATITKNGGGTYLDFINKLKY